MRKIIFFLGILLVIGLLLWTAIKNTVPTKENNGKIKIVTTLFPQYDFAKNIGGEKVEVVLLLPPGLEPHAFEPKPSDISAINQSQIFVYTGAFMEPWAEDIIKGINQNVRVVDVSQGVAFQIMLEDQHEDDHDDVLSEGVDPHIWLDFSNAQTMAQNIAQALIEIDPDNSAYYQSNLARYQTELSQLDQKYQQTLSNCNSQKIIHGGHYSFGYLAHRYNLEYVSAQGFSPNSEPTAKTMMSLAKQVKEEKATHIFYEELISPRVAEVLARETGAKLLLLNGTHNLSKEDYESKATFVSLMEKNLENLNIGLGCQ